MIPPTYNPRTRKFNERPITRDEESFSELYEDLTPTKLPRGGVSELENYRIINGLPTTRGGGELWASDTDPTISGATTYSGTSTISGNIRTVTITSPAAGDTSLYCLPNRFLRFATRRERIIERTSATSIKTRTNESTNTLATVTNAVVVGARWGKHYSRSRQQIYHHIGSELYYSDITMTSYTRCVRLG
ncbi:MAG: hypothetical protein ABIH23_04300, partial [bacterium]